MFILLLAVSAACLILFPILKRYFLNGPLANIPGPPSTSILAGNFLDVYHQDGWKFHHHLASTYGGVSKIHALLGEKQLYIFDPAALYDIIVRNGHIWSPTDDFINTNRVLLGSGIVAALGDAHRKQRKLLIPAFSTTNLREMVPIFHSVSQKFRTSLLTQVQQGSKELDMYTWFTRIALELVGQTGLGYSFDTFSPDATEHEFTRSARELGPDVVRMALAVVYILPWASKIGSESFQRWVVNITPWPALHRVRDIVDIMHRTSTEIYEGKKSAFLDGSLEQQVGGGKDIISILMRENICAEEEDHLLEQDVIGQITTMVFAAMDTTSTALARIFLLLASHPEEQQRLREEVISARLQNGGLDYDALNDLPYMNAIIKETLRLYPPVTQLPRIATEDTVIPLSTPIKGVDGTEVAEIFVPKGTIVGISIIGANRNPAMWGPDALEWKPARWLSDLPKSVLNSPTAGVYSHLLTFMGGSRSCIGFQFSLLEMKVVICDLVASFSFKESDKEIKWDMGSIASPRVGKGHAMPLVVTQLK